MYECMNNMNNMNIWIMNIWNEWCVLYFFLGSFSACVSFGPRLPERESLMIDSTKPLAYGTAPIHPRPPIFHIPLTHSYIPLQAWDGQMASHDWLLSDNTPGFLPYSTNRPCRCPCRNNATVPRYSAAGTKKCCAIRVRRCVAQHEPTTQFTYKCTYFCGTARIPSTACPKLSTQHRDMICAAII